MQIIAKTKHMVGGRSNETQTLDDGEEADLAITDVEDTITDSSGEDKWAEIEFSGRIELF